MYSKNFFRQFIILILLLCFNFNSAFAQDEVNKKICQWGEKIKSFYKAEKYIEASIEGDKLIEYTDKKLKKNDLRLLPILYCLSQVNFNANRFSKTTELIKRRIYLLENMIVTCEKINRDSLKKKYLKSLNDLAFLYIKQGKYNKAKETYEKLYAIATQEFKLKKNDPFVVGIKFKIANIYISKSEYSKAEDILNEIMDIEKARKIRDVNFILNVRNSLALLYGHQAKYDESIKICKENLSEAKNLFGKDSKKIIPFIFKTALFFKMKGDYKKARTYYNDALKLSGRNTINEVSCFESIAGLLLLKGEIYEAISYYNKASKILTQNKIRKNSPRMIGLKQNIALAYLNVGYYSKAEDLLKECLILSKGIFDERYEKAVLFNELGTLYLQQGRYKEAEMYYIKASQFIERVFNNKHRLVQSPLSNRAQLYIRQKKYQEAKELSEKTIKIIRNNWGDNDVTLCSSYSNLAQVYMTENNYKKAEELIKKAIDIGEKYYGKYNNNISSYYLLLAENFKCQGKIDEAEEMFKMALKITEKSFNKNHPSRTQYSNALAYLYLSASQKESEAFKLMSDAIQQESNYISQHFLELSDQNKLDYLNKIEKNYYKFLTFIFNTDAKKEKTCFVSNILLNRKMLTIRAFSQQKEIKNKADKTLISLAIKISNLVSLGLDKDRAEIEELQFKYNNKESDIYRSLYKENKSIGDSDWKQIVKSLPEDTVLIDFVEFKKYDFKAINEDKWGKQKYMAVVYHSAKKSSQDCKNFEEKDLPEPILVKLSESKNSKTNLNEAIRQFNKELKDTARETTSGEIKNLKDKEEKLDKISKKLYIAVFQPIEEKIGRPKRIFISPDGELCNLSFEALKDEKSRYLLERNYPINYVFCGRDILDFKKEENNTEIQTAALINHTYGELFNEGRRVYKELNKYFDSVNIYIDKKQYTKAEYIKEKILNMPIPGVLHINSHGEYNKIKNVNPLLCSWISLSQYRERKSIENRLTAFEITNMNLKGCNLVVLSACKSGLGDSMAGEGILGLRRSFLMAGVPTIVTSLWSIPSKETGVLMDSFYENYLNKKLDKSEALRQAKLKILKMQRQKNNGHAHPYLWGAFICIGNPK